MDKLVSFFQNFTDVSSNERLEDIFCSIKSGTHKNEVEAIRKLLANNETDKAAELKKKLPSFTVAGTFKSKRNNINIDVYSANIILDYDKLIIDQMDFLTKELNKLDFVYSFFVSPGGKGLKVIVAVDTGSEQHEIAFRQVVKFFNELFEIPIDISGKDIARLCFLSYDPNCYINTNVKPFKVQLKDSINYDAAFFQATQLTQQKIDYVNGNRNNFIHQLACNANRFAIPKDYTESMILNQYDLDASEVKRTVDAVYVRNAEEHGRDKGKKNIVDTVEKVLLSRYEFRHNEITTRIEFMDREKLPNEFESLTDYKENSVLRWLLKKGLKINQTLLKNIIRSDFSRQYNAFGDYFSNLPQYDGKSDFIKELAGTVKTHNDELWYLSLKKWLVAMVACATTNKTNHTVLVFAGSQGIGKTTWILNLIPPQLQNYVYSGNINPNNKDTLVHLSECVLINMDELESLNKSEIGTLKEVITKGDIRIRKAYGVNQENMPRRASFSGSVNSMQFLNDTTGSRRFLCFEVSSIDYTSPVNYPGVFSQAVSLLNSGFQYWFDQEEIELITANNDRFQLVSQEEELLLAYFEPKPFDVAELFLTNSEIVNRIKLKTGINSVRPRALGNALVKYGFVRIKKDGRQVYAVYEKSIIEIDEQFRKGE